MNKRSMNMVLRCSFSAFDTDGWVAGRAPGLLKKLWQQSQWGSGLNWCDSGQLKKEKPKVEYI